MKSPSKERRTRLGRDIEEAFLELAAGLRGEIELDQYELEVKEGLPSRAYVFAEADSRPNRRAKRVKP